MITKNSIQNEINLYLADVSHFFFLFSSVLGGGGRRIALSELKKGGPSYLEIERVGGFRGEEAGWGAQRLGGCARGGGGLNISIGAEIPTKCICSDKNMSHVATKSSEIL